MQPDAERNLIGQCQRRLLLLVRAPPQRVANDDQEPHGQQRDQRNQDRGIERADRRGSSLTGLLPHVDDEEGEQPDGEREDEVHAAATQAA